MDDVREVEEGLVDDDRECCETILVRRSWAATFCCVFHFAGGRSRDGEMHVDVEADAERTVGVEAESSPESCDPSGEIGYGDIDVWKDSVFLGGGRPTMVHGGDSIGYRSATVVSSGS